MRHPPDVTAYYQLVWDIVRQIPRGRVATYGQIASMIPPPTGVEALVYDKISPQWVGNALHAIPDTSDIPWQRVINSMGKISFPVGSRQALLQRHLLEAEGVMFDDADRVNFDEFGWDGPAEDWLREHHLHAPRPISTKTKGRQRRLF